MSQPTRTTPLPSFNRRTLFKGMLAAGGGFMPPGRVLARGHGRAGHIAGVAFLEAGQRLIGGNARPAGKRHGRPSHGNLMTAPANAVTNRFISCSSLPG